VEQDKLYDAVDLLNNRVPSGSLSEELYAMRPAPPALSHTEGVYEERIEVALTAGEGFRIYVSLTGDYPSVLTGLYTAPLALGPGVTGLIAVAVSDGGLVSDVAEAEFTLENIIDPVVFSDPAIEAVLRKTINKPDGQVFTSDLWDIEELIFDEEAADYRTLDDLRLCPRLRTLKLKGLHNPCDISVLPELEDLTDLSLDSMGIDSIMLVHIAPLTWLQRLYLPNNGIGPLSHLSALTALTVLDLSSNSVLELTPLGGMGALQYLGLSQNAIEDLAPLGSLGNLRTLLLDRNRILSLKGLAVLTRLETLNVSFNPRLTSLSEVAGLTSLTVLKASNCQIGGSLPSFSRLTSLRELSLASNGITDIEGLRGLTALQTLTLTHNSIESLAPLSDASGLQTLNASNNSIESISSLRGLPALAALSVENNFLRTLTPLRECPALRNVFAFGNAITDPLNTWDGTGVNVRWVRS
jgi:Leucine-rich repeat (LRR) protein